MGMGSLSAEGSVSSYARTPLIISPQGLACIRVSLKQYDVDIVVIVGRFDVALVGLCPLKERVLECQNDDLRLVIPVRRCHIHLEIRMCFDKPLAFQFTFDLTMNVLSLSAELARFGNSFVTASCTSMWLS